jgi:hypothetical protein
MPFDVHCTRIVLQHPGFVGRIRNVRGWNVLGLQSQASQQESNRSNECAFHKNVGKKSENE